MRVVQKRPTYYLILNVQTTKTCLLENLNVYIANKSEIYINIAPLSSAFLANVHLTFSILSYNGRISAIFFLKLCTSLPYDVGRKEN